MLISNTCLQPTVYIHYGHLASEFDPGLVAVRFGAICTKPDKGLWASPVDATWGWKAWCDAEQWSCCDMSKSFEFTLSPKAKILHILDKSDINPYIVSYEGFESLDREKLYNDFDGIELHLSQNPRLSNSVFQMWDCDSICVWNPDVINLQ